MSRALIMARICKTVFLIKDTSEFRRFIACWLSFSAFQVHVVKLQYEYEIFKCQWGIPKSSQIDQDWPSPSCFLQRVVGRGRVEGCAKCPWAQGNPKVQWPLHLRGSQGQRWVSSTKPVGSNEAVQEIQGGGSQSIPNQSLAAKVTVAGQESCGAHYQCWVLLAKFMFVWWSCFQHKGVLVGRCPQSSVTHTNPSHTWGTRPLHPRKRQEVTFLGLV